MSDWGQGVINNTIEWGRGADNNDIGWGYIYGSSSSGDTALEVGASFLLDQYPGASAAYSVRKLYNSATNALRVRRSSDNAHQDIGFVGEDLDESSLISFVGVGNGFDAIWYDQTPNANNASNGLAASQADVVTSGSVILVNGKPAIDFGTEDFLSFSDITPITTFIVGKLDALSLLNYALFNLTAARGYIYGGTLAGANGIGVFDGATKTITGEDLNQHLGYFNYTGTQYQIARDGGAVTNLTAGSNFALNQIGRSTSSLSFNGKLQEIIIFPTDQSANKAAIEANINAYYSIY